MTDILVWQESGGGPTSPADRDRGCHRRRTPGALKPQDISGDGSTEIPAPELPPPTREAG